MYSITTLGGASFVNRYFFPIAAYCSLLLIIFSTSSAILFEGCDNTYNIKSGMTFLESPYYPNNYPPLSTCRYTFIAPLDHEIEINCTVNLPVDSTSCTTEFLYVSTDGDHLLRGAETFCGTDSFIRKTLFRKLTMAYLSYGNTGNFHCQLNVARQPCDCGWSVNEKISNGVVAKSNEFPSIVALNDIKDEKAVFCGGSIIKNNFLTVTHRHIVTAGRCVQLHPIAANIRAYIGVNDMTDDSHTPYEALYYIERIIEHPEYSAYPLQNDIALLVTTKDITWSRGVGPICLPTLRRLQDPFTFSNVDVAGWGVISIEDQSPTLLQKITLAVADNAECIDSYKNYQPILPSQICTYDKSGNYRDTCQYDYGGPVILRSTRQFLLGIISFGTVCGKSKNAMSVNTRVTAFVQWIVQQTGVEICEVPM